MSRIDTNIPAIPAIIFLGLFSNLPNPANLRPIKFFGLLKYLAPLRYTLYPLYSPRFTLKKLCELVGGLHRRGLCG